MADDFSSGYSLVPVDYQPEFEGVTLVPVDHNPFADDGHGTQLAQAQPQSQPQPAATNAGPPSTDVSVNRSSVPSPDHGSPSTPGDDYPSADAAAIAALQSVNRTSQLRGHEYAGRIYQKWLGFGDYSYSPPEEGRPFSSEPGNSLLTPLLHSLGVNAGTYHTHIRGNDPVLDEQYSPGDTEKNDYEGAPGYLATPSGAIYKYSPIPNQPSHGNVSVIGKTNAPALPANSLGVLKPKAP